jgi:hypothetical protein
MTKQSTTTPAERPIYRVCFMETTCYKTSVRARTEQHAIRLAKRRWFYGSNKSFTPYSGETDAWDAELDD